MPSVRPKPGETVAVHFTSIEPDGTITKIVYQYLVILEKIKNQGIYRKHI